MSGGREQLGIVAEGERRRLLYAASKQPSAMRVPVAVAITAPRPTIVVRDFYWKGRHIPPALTRLMGFVAQYAGIQAEALTGLGRRRKLVEARSCIAVLALDVCPRLTDDAIDQGMLRGKGMTRWYRERHSDRMRIHPSYAALYERCKSGIVR